MMQIQAVCMAHYVYDEANMLSVCHLSQCYSQTLNITLHYCGCTGMYHIMCM